MEKNNKVREAVNIYQTKIIILFIINENNNNSFINIIMFWHNTEVLLSYRGV